MIFYEKTAVSRAMKSEYVQMELRLLLLRGRCAVIKWYRIERNYLAAVFYLEVYRETKAVVHKDYG